MSQPTSIIVLGAGGRMGSIIARLAQESPLFKLVAVVERPDREASIASWDCIHGTNVKDVLPQAPGAVIIDFTSPDATMAVARVNVAYGNPHVIGTTGLTEGQKSELANLAQKAPMFWSPNMSVGINVLLKVLPELVRLLGDQYDLEMVELHHKHKKDAPSGTALRLAECLAEAKGWKLRDVGRYEREGMIGERAHEEIGVQTIRGGDVVGVHTVYCLGPGERLEITHQAHSRENFAQGALRAAGWLAGRKPGRLYSMLDIL